MTKHAISRRTFLEATAGAGVLAAATPLLSSCGSTDPGSRSSAAGTTQSKTPEGVKTKIPAYVARYVVNPDLPRNSDGVPDAYFHYPAEPKRVDPGTPTENSKISILKNGGTPPPGLGKNLFWQELNKRVGADLSISQVLYADYSQKLATTFAGGDIPDYVQIFFGTPRLSDVMRANFEDLSPWLAGDAVKKWPNLAATPAGGWEAVQFGGGLWGIPRTFSSPAFHTPRIRKDIFDQHGITDPPASGDDLMAICKELTDVRKNRWAFGGLLYTPVAWVSRMIGVPNVWAEKDGKFTRDIETEEYKEMLDQVNQIRLKGYCYPDLATNLAQIDELFAAGKAAFKDDAYTNFTAQQIAGRATDPNFNAAGMLLPKWDGSGQAGHYLGPWCTAYMAVKKSKSSRVEELLDVLNWFGSQFGSEEWLFVNYGIPKRDYTLEGTDPKATESGAFEVGFTLSYMSNFYSQGIYAPGSEDDTKSQYTYLKELLKVTVDLPTIGLFSDTQLSTGATIDNNITSLMNDIITGRKKVSDWAAGVKAWRSGGGDQIRAEYEQAFEQRADGK